MYGKGSLLSMWVFECYIVKNALMECLLAQQTNFRITRAMFYDKYTTTYRIDTDE